MPLKFLKICKNPFHSAQKSSTDAIKAASKKVIPKIAEATDDLIGNKITDKITGIKISPQNASKELHSKADENEIEIPKERLRYVSRKMTKNCW